MPSARRHVYVISDLHIGGVYPAEGDARKRGFRMCRSVPLLVEFINQLAAKPASLPRLELVINGDFVDFLAESWDSRPVFRPFLESEDLAVVAFRRIADRDVAVFDALGNLLANGHDLTILLGNHDVELSYGRVRAELSRRLKLDNARGQLRFLLDGESYVAGDLLIEHGNRYDGYNVIDHDGLRRLRSAASRRAALPAKFGYRIPPGSLLVSTVMNRLKEQYSFVDLIKPETEASIPILLALAPGARRHALAILKLHRAAKKHAPGSDGEPQFGSDIAASGPPPAFNDDLAEAMAHAEHSLPPRVDELATLVDQIMPGRGSSFVATLRCQSEGGSEDARHQDDDNEPDDQGDARGAPGTDYRALLRLAIARETAPLSSRLDALQDALQVLRGDTSWRRDVESTEYMESVEKRFAAGFRCVIYGHTHLAKCVRREPHVYINTGTWADLIEVPRDVLARTSDGRAKLEQFCRRLESGDLEQIAAPVPTYAHVMLERTGDDERVEAAELCDFASTPVQL
jgi:UDP-2,3-diacylglucosamine pyrophosphatase LpxH